MTGGGPHPRGVKLLSWNWPCGGDVEGSGRYFKSPAHSLRRLPRLPPQISGGSRPRYYHPRGQAASEASGLEVEGHVRDLITPWAGPGAWMYWKVAAWAPGPVGSSRCIGGGL